MQVGDTRVGDATVLPASATMTATTNTAVTGQAAGQAESAAVAAGRTRNGTAAGLLQPGGGGASVRNALDQGQQAGGVGQAGAAGNGGSGAVVQAAQGSNTTGTTASRALRWHQRAAHRARASSRRLLAASAA